MAYRLTNPDLVQLGRVRHAAAYLQTRAQDMAAGWDDATEKWQESERGQKVYEWITELEDKARELEDLADEIEGMTPDDYL